MALRFYIRWSKSITCDAPPATRVLARCHASWNVICSPREASSKGRSGAPPVPRAPDQSRSRSLHLGYWPAGGSSFNRDDLGVQSKKQNTVQFLATAYEKLEQERERSASSQR